MGLRQVDRAVLQALRARLAMLENPVLRDAPPPVRWSFGTPALDDALPSDTLLAHRLHEAMPAAHDDATSAAGFLAALIARLQQAVGPGEVLWCRRGFALQELGGLYGPGLVTFGLDPARLIEVRVRRDSDVLWAMEEGLRSRALLVVVGEVGKLDLTASRRLTLAARASGVTPLLLRPSEEHGATAAWTRWRVATAASTSAPSDDRAPGRPRWQIELVRARSGAPPQRWTVEWHHETHGFAVAAALADRALAARSGRQR